MNVWICIAYDPLPGVDHTTRLLRYGTLAEQLAATGHSVVLWTSTFDHWRKKQRFERDHVVQTGPNLRIELLHSPAYFRNVSWARIRHNRALAASFLARTARAVQPDIVFAGIPCLELTEAAAQYAHAKGVPFVADVQDIWPEVYVSLLPEILRPFGRLLLHHEFSRARGIFRRADSITAVSKCYLEWAQRIRGTFGKHDRVFHLGYQMPPLVQLAAARERSTEFKQRLGLPSDRVIVTFLGQFAASYDIDTVVDAAQLLESRKLPVHFVLAGAGDKLARIKRNIAKLSSVTVTGWLEYQDTLTLLQLSDIGLAAYSRTAPQSLPYKPFEYMAFGLPFICSLKGELRDLIKARGLGRYYRAGDAASLAEAIHQLAAERSQRLKAGSNARMLYVEQFEAGLITGRLIAHLQMLARVCPD